MKRKQLGEAILGLVMFGLAASMFLTAVVHGGGKAPAEQGQQKK